MPSDILSELSQWFARHCDGEREHHHGISIQSTDNPGWWVKVDLTGTELADRPFAAVLEGVNAEGFPAQPRWLCCRLQDNAWHGAGDESRLADIVGRFLAWAR